MIEQEILKNNKLVAEFMGYEFTQTPDCGILGGNKFTKVPKKDNTPPFTVYHGWCPPKYHESWNDLMPVVEKIENDCKVHICIYNKSCWIEFYGTHNDLCKFERTNNSFILNVYLAVIEFIKWYLCQKEMKLI